MPASRAVIRVSPRRSTQCSTGTATDDVLHRMRRTLFRRQWLLLALPVFSLGCAGSTTVQGEVTDTNGKGLVGAKVELLHLDAQRTVNAGSGGAFKLTVEHRLTWSTPLLLVASAEGHKASFANLQGPGEFSCRVSLDVGVDTAGEHMRSLPKEACREVP